MVMLSHFVILNIFHSCSCVFFVSGGLTRRRRAAGRRFPSQGMVRDSERTNPMRSPSPSAGCRRASLRLTAATWNRAVPSSPVESNSRAPESQLRAKQASRALRDSWRHVTV